MIHCLEMGSGIITMDFIDMLCLSGYDGYSCNHLYFIFLLFWLCSGWGVFCLPVCSCLVNQLFPVPGLFPVTSQNVLVNYTSCLAHCACARYVWFFLTPKFWAAFDYQIKELALTDLVPLNDFSPLWVWLNMSHYNSYRVNAHALAVFRLPASLV